MWLITNKSFRKESRPELNYLSLSGIQVITDQPIHSGFSLKYHWLVDGNLLPASSDFTGRASVLQPASQESLYLKYKDEFIRHVRGNFIIIRIDHIGFSVYSDPFAIRKYFIWQLRNEFIISDNLTCILELVKLTPSVLNMALYSVFYHFTGGRTLFSEVRHNQPGEIVEYDGQKIRFKQYWHPRDLLNNSVKEITIDRLTGKIKNFISATILGDQSISLSLTGGGDTRNLLAAFLALGIRPHLYTYGNPASVDGVRTKTIARGLGLDHIVHDIKMDKDTFSRRARDIIKLGNGLASIHRVHRLVAVEREKEFADYMYLGSLGGEFVKGVSEDDYIIPSVVYKNWRLDHLTPSDVRHYLTLKRVKAGDEILADITDQINNEPFMKGDLISRKINALSYITAHLHDAQDINLYRSVMKEVFTPFLDIDYLETIFSSRYSFSIKELEGNKYLKRLSNPVYSSEFLRNLFPPLLGYKYSGEHKPSEVLFNKYYAALMKTIRQKTKPRYPVNFALGKWMEDFIAENLPPCYDYPVLRQTFDLDRLIEDLRNDKHTPVESYWLKFSNPVMMRFIIEEFKNV